MVDKRSGPRIDELRQKLGEALVDEHIAIIGPRTSGKTFLAQALAARFHDGGRGNTVEIHSDYGGRGARMQVMTGSPEQHKITIYDGFLPERPYQQALRIISVDALG